MSEQENTFVTVRMPSELVKQIDELATEAMRSRSAQVIMMLKQALVERGQPQGHYCETVAIWKADAARGVTANDRAGWPPFDVECN